MKQTYMQGKDNNVKSSVASLCPEMEKEKARFVPPRKIKKK
jgi:hypothetical protein